MRRAVAAECGGIINMNFRVPTLIFALLIPLSAADPNEPRFWSARQMKDMDSRISANIDPARHLGSERFMDSAFELHRDGPSEGEIHDKLAHFIIVRSGEGALLIGGKLIGAKVSAVDEQRGPSIEGGQKYPVSAGDVLYVPANTPHQFLVEPGKSLTATIVKITPKK